MDAGNLRDHEDVAQPGPARAERGLHPHRRDEVDPRRLQRRQERGHDAGKRDEQNGEADEPAIDADMEALRDGGGQAEGRQQIGAPARDDDGCRAAHDSQEQSFDRELADDARAARAERRAHADLALAIRTRAPGAAPRR